MRIFLTNYLRDADTPADINDLDGGPIASARRAFDEAVGVEASDLTPEEIDHFRPGVYVQMAAQAEGTLFLKVHDAYVLNVEGEPLFPAAATQGVIYLLRNPLDVAVSFAHHSSLSLDKMVPRLCDEGYTLAYHEHKLASQLRQRLLSWRGHVVSWVETSGLPVHVVRYEDMVEDTVATFTKAVRFAGLPVNAARVEKALAFSSFERLQAMERDHGFHERAAKAPSFFRKGKVGDWRNALTDAHVAQLIAAHRDVMLRFGYLDESGNPVY
jgi:hypothetical protein